MNPDRFPDQDIYKKNFKKYSGKFFSPFFGQKLQFTCPLASLKVVQAKGEAFSPPKRTSSTSKNQIFLF
jgi:hypothetical protein